MAARFTEPIQIHHAEIIAAAVDETLLALNVAMDVPISLLPRHSVKEEAANTVAYASRNGIQLFLDTLDLDDDRLRSITIEEVGHLFLFRGVARLASSVQLAELFANWTVHYVTGGSMVIPKRWASDGANAGRYAACALAGFVEGRDALEAHSAAAMVRMVDRLDERLGDDRTPQRLVTLLVAELDGR